MKTLRITLFTAVVALAAAVFTGCGGATGPAGPAGTDGIDGATGPQGPSGVTGTAFSFTVNNADWVASSASGYNFDIASYQNGSIGTYLTSNNIATGVVAVYFQTVSGGSWVPLSDTYPIATGVEQTMTYNYNVNSLTLQVQNSDNSVPVAPPSFTINVVIIPTSLMKRHPGLNTKDYYEVMQVIKSAQAGSL